MELRNTLNSQSNLEKEEQSWKHHASWFQIILQAAAAKSLQSCLTLCDPIEGSSPGSPVPGILQARTLEWGCHFLLQRMYVKSETEVAQSCPTLSDPMDCSLSGSCVQGLFQARVLEWGAIVFFYLCVSTKNYVFHIM